MTELPTPFSVAIVQDVKVGAHLSLLTCVSSPYRVEAAVNGRGPSHLATPL